MSAATADVRPQGDSPAVVQAAIEANAAERQTAEAHLAELRDRRGAALLDPTKPAKQIVSIETEIREIELRIERLEAVRPQLHQKYRQAETMAQHAAVDREIDRAMEAIGRFKAALEGYPQHAAAIVAICRLNQEALAAVSSAQRLARTVGNAPAFDVPGGAGGVPFNERVALPWNRGEGMMWGQTPTKASSSIYQPMR